MGIRAYFGQYYAILVQSTLRRWRMPISTVVELLLPSLVMLLLGACYWLSTSTTSPGKMYDTPVINMSVISGSSFCTSNESSLNGRLWRTCNTLEVMCLPTVADGGLCLPQAKVKAVSGSLFAMYYGSGPFYTDSMDGYLTLSAFNSYLTMKDDPTFFGRTGKASLSHYGELLVSSSDAGVAQEFMTFCQERSRMCAEVLHSTAFASFEDAQRYAMKHEGRVWAIVDLPADAVTTAAEFTIGMNYTATPLTFPKPKRLFQKPQEASGSAGYVLYWTSGFLTLQSFVEQFYLHRRRDAFGAPVPLFQNLTAQLHQYGTAVVPMPVPPYFKNSFLDSWSYYLPLVATLVAMFPVSKWTGLLVQEKADGIREAMLIMGLYPSCLFAGWYTLALVFDVATSLLAALVLWVGVLDRVDYAVIFVVYFSFLQQMTSLSGLLSTFFSNPRIASWSGAFVLFLCAMPFYELPPGMKESAKIGVSFIPCVGFAQAIDEMLRAASLNLHYGWEMANEGSFNVVVIIGVIWGSTCIMALLTLYFDRVLPSGVGRRDHPLFFLMPLIQCCCTKKQTLVDVSLKGKDGAADDGEGEKLAMIEQRDGVVDTSDDGIAVIFYRVCKEYHCGGLLAFLYTYFSGFVRKGYRCCALKDVTFTMRMGEVTVLLGPNGAGKSTIMGVATGMVSPTSGDVYLRGHNAKYDLSGCRRSVGYCPQENILWSSLTVEEHLIFYARLKGTAVRDVSAAVKEVVELLGLTDKMHMRANTLSGGQKRRLCVGIALIGKSEVLFLDEPTAGMDVKGRRLVYNALNAVRAERSVLISSHLLDEADRIGDQILMVGEGEVRGKGSSMFLKSQVPVGYIVTCVLVGGLTPEEETSAVSRLMDFVREDGFEGHHTHGSEEVVAVPPTCQLLGVGRRGREVSFRFRLDLLSSAGCVLLHRIEDNRKQLLLHSVGMNLTSLEDVFMSLAHGCRARAAALGDGGEMAVAEQNGTPVSGKREGQMVHAGYDGYELDDVEKSDCLQSYNFVPQSSGTFMVFARHFRALFIKRLHAAKRDARLLVFQVVLPVAFLLLSLLMNLVGTPTQPSLRLDASMYKNYDSQLHSSVHYTFALFGVNAFNIRRPLPNAAFGEYYNGSFSMSMSTNGTQPLSLLMQRDIMNHTAPRNIAMSFSNMLFSSGPPAFVSAVMHNESSPHAAPEALSALYNVANYQLFNTRYPQLAVRNRPFTMGNFESKLDDTSKQVIIGIFILVPFIIIPSNTISYIVREKESGARHLQWLSGASVAAYWLSAFVFDALCYVGTELLTIIMFFIFRRTEYISKDTAGPTVVLFLLYGISSIPLSYVLSFLFTSPFTAQSVVLVVNFLVGFVWVTVESMVGGSALGVTRVVTSILRVFPSVNFGEGMFTISGVALANMMFPNRAKSSLYGLLYFKENGGFTGGIGTGMIYMSVVLVVSCILLVIFEYLRIQRFSLVLSRMCCGGDREGRLQSNPIAVDNDIAFSTVQAEEDRVCSEPTGPANDRIAIQHLTKRYAGASRRAVDNVSLGVQKGEIMALLGLNGSGKTTTVGMLAGEVIASSGSAFVNHLSVLDSSSRKYIGYCPQFDALLDNLSVVEHLWLYARLRGFPEELIDAEVSVLISELGLWPHRRQAACALSGGNKRRLSLAIALVGNTTGVLLDEPTSGMDTLARAQTCRMVKRLTRGKSVILTTHLLEETEALADRAAFMVKGCLRCVGTLQELRSIYTQDSLYTVRVLFNGEVNLMGMHDDVPERVRQHLLCNVQEDADEKGVSPSSQVCEVLTTSMTLNVCGRLFRICKAVADLRNGDVEGVPSAMYISATQPTLEDIMLMD